MSSSNTIQVIRHVLAPFRYKVFLVLSWALIVTLFLWLPQINLLSYILTQAPISGAEKAEFFVTYYPRVLSEIMNPIVLSLVIFSLLTAVSILLLVYMVRSGRHKVQSTAVPVGAYAATAGSAFGSHLLSCGGTLLLASAFPAFSGSSAVMGGSGAAVNTGLATGANLVGIFVVLYVIRKISRDITAMALEPAKHQSERI